MHQAQVALAGYFARKITALTRLQLGVSQRPTVYIYRRVFYIVCVCHVEKGSLDIQNTARATRNRNHAAHQQSVFETPVEHLGQRMTITTLLQYCVVLGY